MLRTYGAGDYDIGASIRLASGGSVDGQVVIQIIRDGAANIYQTVSGTLSSDGFTALSGTVNLNWGTATITEAFLFFQTPDFTGDYYLDDVVFRRSREMAFDEDVNVIIYPRTNFAANPLSYLSHDGADFAVRVNGMGIPVYQFNQNPATGNRNPANTRATFGTFSFENGSVTVEIDVNVPMHSFRILPTNTGIDVTRRGNTLTFTLDEPRQLMLEINGEIDGQLMLFANEPSSTGINTSASNVFVVDRKSNV